MHSHERVSNLAVVVLVNLVRVHVVSNLHNEERRTVAAAESATEPRVALSHPNKRVLARFRVPLCGFVFVLFLVSFDSARLLLLISCAVC